MNKLIVFAALLLSSMPFAFFKMEKPKWASISYVRNSSTFWNRLKSLSEDMNDEFCIMIKSKDINFEVISKSTWNDKKWDAKCDKYVDFFFNMNPIFSKKNPLYFVSIYCNNSLTKEKFIKFNKKFYISSGVLVTNNENKVEISNKNKTYNFQGVLIKYFNKNIAMAEAICNIKENQFLNRSVYALGKASHDILNRGEDQIKLLNSSNILNIFAVIKGIFNNNSIIWGLAEDKLTKERFHWVTDLEADISVLLK